VTLACATTPAPVRTRPAEPAPPPPAPGPFRLLDPPTGPGGGAGLPVTAARIFAVGDTQLHHLYGKRGWAQSPFADRWSGLEVPIRPAALDDGSDLLLETFLAEHATRYARHSLVYMGDAADLSCTQEYDRFFAIMKGAGLDRFLMVTSNHDGFYVGNFTRKADADGALGYTDMPEDWTRACSEPGSLDDHRLTKGRAVARIAPVLPDAPAWATSRSDEGADDPSGYAKSWLAYARPLGGGDDGAPPAWGLFVDTIDYRGFDLSSTQGAGSVAGVSQEQLDALDRAMFEADVAAGDPAPAWIAFGHHPIVEMHAKARERFLRFLDERPRIVAYVSAHTHYSDERIHELPSGRTIQELVVGSTTDFAAAGAPQSARIIEVRVDPAGNTYGLVSQRLVLDVDALCKGIPALSAANPLHYTAYRIARDDVPDVPTSDWDQFWAWLEDSDLTKHRIAQTSGALLVENKLVRALASLYASAPAASGAAEAGDVDRLVRAMTAIALALSPAPRQGPPSDYDRWLDPVLGEDVPRLARGLHLFGRYRDLFESMRATRRASDERRRFFTCHAARAAEAEADQRRREGKIWRLR
jgi:hypothetical protein